MTARFILTLDCEGLWGVADQLGSNHARALTDRTLREAYDGLTGLLDDTDVPATFAFVAAFILPPQRLHALRPELRRAAAGVPGYVEHAEQACMGEGWSGDWAFEAVRAARTRHEMALHGSTHIPWGWAGFTADAARAELQLAFDTAPELAGHVQTFVYPRNEVAHREVLAEFGIAGAREARPVRSRAGLLVEELTPAAPDADPPPAAPVRIPAGRFLNWRCGPRRAIPPWVTRARFRRSLIAAERSGRVLHLWTHPENLASGPGTMKLLQDVIEDVARMRDAGRCEVLTQADYCERVAPEFTEACRARRDARLAMS